MKVIAFSLYGAHPKYCIGAVRNAELAQKVFPEWQMMLWYDETVPQETLKDLMALSVVLRMADSERFPNGMFWRLLANDEPGVERFLIRDADSRLCERDRLCVDEWIASGKGLHTIRDHPYHIKLLMGGLTGMVTGRIQNMADLAQPYASTLKWGTDEAFLMEKVHPRFGSDFIQHDSCNTGHHRGTLPIPGKRTRSFLGEIVDENEHVNEQHRAMRARHMGIA